MDTKVITITNTKQDTAAIQQAGQIILQGGLVAFPTETVYGLGGDARNPASSQKIYSAKGRPSDNPLIVHICRMEDLQAVAKNIPPAVYLLAEKFWPGPLTMILPKSDLIPYETTGGLETVAVRMPSDPTALAFIQAAGGFVAAPSANTSGRPSPTLAKYVWEDLNGKIEMILDGGEVGIGLESTIVDLTGKVPEILRPGYITKEMLEEVLDRVDTDVTILKSDSTQKPKAPGMKYRHYAPAGELTLVEGTPQKVVDYINEKLLEAEKSGKKTGVICTQETKDLYRAACIKNAGSRQDEEKIARELYRILREFDEEKVEVMYSESFSTAGIGQAIMNRLLKAAGHHVVHVE